MNKSTHWIRAISEFMNNHDDVCIVAVMLLVVSNILLRVFLHHPQEL